MLASKVGARPGILADGDQRVDLDAQLAELVALRDEGLIGAIGLSNVSREQIERALPVGIACVQNSHNLLERSGERSLELCRAHGVAWVPFCPLGSAFAGHPKVADNPTVRRIADELGATPDALDLTP